MRYASSRRRCPTSLRSPRREWLSLGKLRRCSVSPRIRSVSRAIWTSGDPVSPSCTALSVMMLSLASRASGTRPSKQFLLVFFFLVPAESNTMTRSERLREPFARADGIAFHLRDKSFGRAELALTAQAPDELDSEPLPVQVPIKVEQVDLEQALPSPERRSHPEGSDTVCSVLLPERF